MAYPGTKDGRMYSNDMEGSISMYLAVSSYAITILSTSLLLHVRHNGKAYELPQGYMARLGTTLCIFHTLHTFLAIGAYCFIQFGFTSRVSNADISTWCTKIILDLTAWVVFCSQILLAALLYKASHRKESVLLYSCIASGAAVVYSSGALISAGNILRSYGSIIADSSNFLQLADALMVFGVGSFLNTKREQGTLSFKRARHTSLFLFLALFLANVVRHTPDLLVYTRWASPNTPLVIIIRLVGYELVGNLYPSLVIYMLLRLGIEDTPFAETAGDSLQAERALSESSPLLTQ